MGFPRRLVAGRFGAVERPGTLWNIWNTFSAAPRRVGGAPWNTLKHLEHCFSGVFVEWTPPAFSVRSRTRVLRSRMVGDAHPARTPASAAFRSTDPYVDPSSGRDNWRGLTQRHQGHEEPPPTPLLRGGESCECSAKSRYWGRRFVGQVSPALRNGNGSSPRSTFDGARDAPSVPGLVPGSRVACAGTRTFPRR